MTLARVCVGKAGVDGRLCTAMRAIMLRFFLRMRRSCIRRGVGMLISRVVGGGVGEGFLCGPLGPAFSID